MNKHTLSFLLLMISLGLSAQVQKNFLLFEAGINLGENTGFLGTSGISFESKDFYTKEYQSGIIQSYKVHDYFGYSLAPRIGYTIFNNCIVGADLNYRKKFYKFDNYGITKNRYRSVLSGIFIRQYLGKGKLLPFIDAGLGFGESKSVNDESSPGGAKYEDVEHRNLFYYSAAAGVSYSAGSKININLFVKSQRTKEKPINTETSHFGNYKIIDFDTAVVLSFSFFFRKELKSEIENMNISKPGI